MQGRAAAEEAAAEAAEQVSAADREQELLEGQLEQLTASLQHEAGRKAALEARLHHYEQARTASPARCIAALVPNAPCHPAAAAGLARPHRLRPAAQAHFPSTSLHSQSVDKS